MSLAEYRCRRNKTETVDNTKTDNAALRFTRGLQSGFFAHPSRPLFALRAANVLFPQPATTDLLEKDAQRFSKGLSQRCARCAGERQRKRLIV